MGILSDVGAAATSLAKAARAGAKRAEQALSGPVEATDDQAQALLWDPYAIVDQLGYKDRPSSISYDTLQGIVTRVPLIQAVIVTRLNQLSRFCRPRRDMFLPGFRVTPVERGAKLSAADRKFSGKMESMFMTTGVTDYALGRDDFETFIRKIARDALTYDQSCYEIVKNRKGLPAKFQAVDAATIRIADSASVTYTEDPEQIATVQIYDGMVIGEWRRDEMAFTVRNPHSNIRLFGYGYSEIEMLVNAITSWLWGFDYNSRFFNQGTVTKGLLNIESPMNRTELNAFRRNWHQQVSGVENAWRSPVLNGGGKVEWINMSQNNRDMEFSAWMDFLIKLICGIYQIDPMELGFKYGDTGQSKAMFESGTEAKLTASKDRGLSPLLEHIAGGLTRYLVQPIDPDWQFEFVGLEHHSKDDLAKLNKERVSTTHTVNELRAEQDLEPLEGKAFNVPLSPVIVQLLQAEQGGGEDADDSDGGEAAQGDDGGEEAEAEGASEGDDDDAEEMSGDDVQALFGKKGPDKAQKSVSWTVTL